MQAATPMSNIQRKIIQQALRNLAGAGAQYAVIDPEGVKHGSLELAPPPPKKRRSWARLVPLLDAAKPGTATIFTVEPGENIDILQAAVCSGATPRFGKDGYSTSRSGDTVELWLPFALKGEPL